MTESLLTPDLLTPGWPEYPEYNTEIISPLMPSGVGWLANCLMELGVPLWQPWDRPTNRLWQRLAPYHYRYLDREDKMSSWQQTIPALSKNREFKFAADVVPKISHAQTRKLGRDNKLVLFVRDPRDALYSDWRRQITNGLEQQQRFEQYLDAPFRNTDISNLQYISHFLQHWAEHLDNTPHVIVRFEDYKTDAKNTLAKVLSFLNMQPSVSAINHALLVSSFDAGKKIEQQREQAGTLERRLYRAGRAYEYRTTYSKKLIEQVAPDLDGVCDWLDYGVSKSISGNME